MSLIYWVLPLSLAVLSWLITAPPSPVSRAASATQFSAERAFEHVQKLAQAPGPVGTPEHAAARDYLLAELRALGFEAELQTAHSATSWFGKVRAGRVENVVARFKGLRPGPAVLLAAHYDTVPHSPGAGDDRSGVAALLETARALRGGPWLRNDVIFLFSDAEELGLLGALAFVAEHRWAKDVAVALNFDARGNRGQAALYDTSTDNGQLIRWFADAAPYPTANSLLPELIRFLPNDSDLSVFKRASIASYGFAFADGLEAYHRPSDRPQALDQGSLQHQGSYALSLTRVLGQADLRAVRAPKRG
jgi:hypothetical protein